MAYCSCLQAPGLVACCARKRECLCHSQFFSFLLNYFSDQWRLQGGFHLLSAAWQHRNSSIGWKRMKVVTDPRVWPLAAMDHLNGMCSCLCSIWKCLGDRHSSGIGLVASASALQIRRSSFRRSFEAKLSIFLREVKVKFDTGVQRALAVAQQCRAWSNGSTVVDPSAKVNIVKGKVGRSNGAQSTVLLWGCGSAGFAGVFLVLGSTCWPEALLYSERNLIIY